MDRDGRAPLLAASGDFNNKIVHTGQGRGETSEPDAFARP